jgi:hypothetical protein
MTGKRDERKQLIVWDATIATSLGQFASQRL